jgi:hypothetical protein
MQTIEWVGNLKNFVNDEFSYDIKGASILIVIDHENKTPAGTTIKLIDLPSVIKFDSDSERDTGFIKGLCTIEEHLELLYKMVT